MKSGNRSSNLFVWLKRTFFEYLYPARCICCKKEAPVGMKTSEYVMLADPDSELRGVFCGKCMSDFLASCAQKCPECGRPYLSCRCAPAAIRDAGIGETYVCFSYDKSRRVSAASKLIYSLKSMDNRDSVNFAAHLLCGRIRGVLENDTGNIVVTYAPRRRESVRVYGGDHMKKTAELIAKELGCGFAGIGWRPAVGYHGSQQASS